MTMSAKPTLAFKIKTLQNRVARDSGWSWADIYWEQAMVGGNDAWRQGRPIRAKCVFAIANVLSRLFFTDSDPRRATAYINQAIIFQKEQKTNRALAKIKKAQKIWSKVDTEIDNVEIAPRARSSLFHLRMEAKHRDTYHQNFKIRLKKFAQETADSIDCIEKGRGVAHRHYSRWNGERPNMYDDTRKVFAATLLIIDDIITREH